MIITFVIWVHYEATNISIAEGKDGRVVPKEVGIESMQSEDCIMS